MSANGELHDSAPTRSGRLAISLALLVSLTFMACGGRANKSGSAKAPATGPSPAAQEQPANTPASEGGATAAAQPAAAPATPSVAAAAAGPGAPASPTASPGKAEAASGAAPSRQAASARPNSAAGGGAPAKGTPDAGTAAPGSSAGVPSAPTPAAPGARHTGPANLSIVNLGTICECSGPPGASIGAGIASNQTMVKWINENGGLNGHPIKLFVDDSNSDPNRYFTILKRMVEVDKVIAFVGHMSPLTVNAGDKYLREKGIPVVGGDGAHGLWFGSPVLFFPGPSYFNMAVATARYAFDIGTPKVAMLYCAEAQPCQVGHDALHSKLKDEKAPNTEIVYEAKVSLAQPDFSAECLQAKSHGAQAVILYIDAAAASRLTRSCLQQSYHPQWLEAPLTSAHPDDPNNEGMATPIATFPWFLDETPAQHVFQEAIRKYNPTLVKNATTSVVWVSGQMLLEATKNLPAENPTSADIMNGMWTIRNNDFGGLLPQPVTFTKDQPSPDHNCYFIVQIHNGAYTAPVGSRPQCF
jgi:branched-chain amino acid transport system substrate-binding protein